MGKARPKRKPNPAGVYRVADRLAPAVRRQWLEAVRRVQDKASLAMISEAIVNRGLTTRVFRALEVFPESLKTMVGTLGVVVERGAQDAERRLAKTLQWGGTFDIVNPRAIEAARLEGARLVVQVTDETKQAIRMVIARAVREGIPPREAARLIQPLIGLTERSAGAVWNYRLSLIQAGQATARVGALTQIYATRLHRQRALLIARTETIRAANAGQQAAWEAAEEKGLIPDVARKRWHAAKDERTCPSCGYLHRKVTTLRGTFQGLRGAVDKPPAHPACRCRMVLVFGKREAA